MPQIPTKLDLGARPTPSANIAVQTADTSALGKAVANLGNQVEDAGSRALVHYQTSTARQAEIELATLQSKLLYDPNHGISSKNGTDAINEANEYKRAWDEGQKEIAKKLSGGALSMFSTAAAQRSLDFNASIDRMVTARRKEYDDAQSDGMYQTFNADVVAAVNADDPARVATTMKRTEQNIEIDANRLGLEGAARQAYRQDKLSSVTKATVTALATKGGDNNIIEAWGLLQDSMADGKMTAQDGVTLTNMLSPIYANALAAKADRGELLAPAPQAAPNSKDTAFDALMKDAASLPAGIIATGNQPYATPDKPNQAATTPAARDTVNINPLTVTAQGMAALPNNAQSQQSSVTVKPDANMVERLNAMHDGAGDAYAKLQVQKAQAAKAAQTERDLWADNRKNEIMLKTNGNLSLLTAQELDGLTAKDVNDIRAYKGFTPPDIEASATNDALNGVPFDEIRLKYGTALAPSERVKIQAITSDPRKQTLYKEVEEAVKPFAERATETGRTGAKLSPEYQHLFRDWVFKNVQTLAASRTDGRVGSKDINSVIANGLMRVDGSPRWLSGKNNPPIDGIPYYDGARDKMPITLKNDDGSLEVFTGKYDDLIINLTRRYVDINGVPPKDDAELSALFKKATK